MIFYLSTIHNPLLFEGLTDRFLKVTSYQNTNNLIKLIDNKAHIAINENWDIIWHKFKKWAWYLPGPRAKTDEKHQNVEIVVPVAEVTFEKSL